MTLRAVRLGACLAFLVASFAAEQARAVVEVVRVVRDEADGLGVYVASAAIDASSRRALPESLPCR